MTSEQVNAVACEMPTKTVTLRLQTPLRLVSDGVLVHRLTFATLIRRIIGRLADLSGAYGTMPLTGDLVPLLTAADQIMVTHDATRWLDVTSHSSRLQRSTPIGGLVGVIGFTGNLAPFLPFLIWGELVQLGKDTTKGNGLYQILPP
jgi:hypothetical protein